MQSPLRAGLLRFLSARPGESFDVESLMATFGRMRLDVENCLNELVEFGVVAPRAGRAGAASPPSARSDAPIAQLLDTFLERRAAISTEDQSPSVQRFREMIGRDEKMLIVFEWIRTAAKSDISVLILGPDRLGQGSRRADDSRAESRAARENFQAVNCAALPDTLFESEIFGYEKGAFTGAHDRKPGRVELADRGTLFLDEIGDLSLVAQAKLLRVLEDRRFERLGGQKSVQVDFRLISATNRPLDQFVRDSRFREDLYYRVNAFSIRLPSLRERPVDIPVLANRFLARYCAANGLPLDAKVFSPRSARAAADAIRGRATSASSRARCRARRCRRRAASSATPTSSSCTPHAGAGRATRRRVCRRCARPSARTSCACSRRRPGTRRKRRACSTSAAARSTARSSSTASSRTRGCPETEQLSEPSPPNLADFALIRDVSDLEHSIADRYSNRSSNLRDHCRKPCADSAHITPSRDESSSTTAVAHSKLTRFRRVNRRSARRPQPRQSFCPIAQPLTYADHTVSLRSVVLGLSRSGPGRR